MIPSSTRGDHLSLGEYTLRIIVTALVIILLLAIWKLRDALLLTFFAIIVAIVLQVPARRLQQVGLSRGLSILVSLLGLISLFVLLVVLIAPVFVAQVSDLIDGLPDTFDSARDEYDRLALENDWLPEIDWDNVAEGDAADFAVEQAGNLSRNIFPFLTGLGGALTSTLFVLLIALFFMTEPTNYLGGLLALVPADYRPRALEIMLLLGDTLRRWFVGQLISMTLSGILIAFATGVVLGLPNAVALGVIAGLMEFIPNFGSIISVIPAVLIALTEDPLLVPVVIVTYLVVQQVQSNLIMPRIMSRQINIPSAAVLIAQIMFAALFGFMGLLLALPLAVLVVVLVREVYVLDVLNTRAAHIEIVAQSDGLKSMMVRTEVHRPPTLTPGAAAQLRAQGQDLSDYQPDQIVEILTAPSPELERVARGQQAVWLAVLTLALAQGLALVRSLLNPPGRA